MSEPKLKPGGNRDPRDIDRLTSKTRSLWGRTYVFIKKGDVKTWKRVFVLAFITGAIAAATWMISIKIHTLLKAEGETAELKLSAAKTAMEKDEIFPVSVVLDTRGNNVVVAKAIVTYDAQKFALQDWNTSDSVFASGNACIYNDKACEIIDNDTANGKITITEAKPKPGINTSSGMIAVLSFKAIDYVSPSSSNFKVNFASAGNYDDSDVIFDDGKGTDILAAVSNLTIAVNHPTCTDFTYSDWGECQPDSTQTRTVTSSTPADCEGGDPVLTQGCSYNPSIVTCTRFKYSKWSECVDGVRTRTVESTSPDGCTVENPVLSEECRGGGPDNPNKPKNK